MKLPNLESFIYTHTGEKNDARMADLIKRVHYYVRSCVEEYKASRQSLERTWMELFAEYTSTAEGQQYIRSNNAPTDPSNPAGATKLNWRHHVSTGKAAEIVEAFVAYWRNAAFPSKNNWFDLQATTPLIASDAGYEERTQYKQFLRILKAYFNYKLQDAKFESHFGLFLRQAAIIGTSCIALPWRYEMKTRKRNVMSQKPDGSVAFERQEKEYLAYNNIGFEVLDMFDVLLDPNGTDMQTANMVRICRKSKAEVARMIRTGFYDLADEDDIKRLVTNSERKSEEQIQLNEIQGVTPQTAKTGSDTVEVYEFWGTVALDDYEFIDVVVTCTKDVILRFEQNPYWAGRPFIFGRPIPIIGNVYGCSPLQFIQGGLVTLNKLTNQRLDSIDYTLEPTLLVEEDAVNDLSDVYIQAGRSIPVRSVEGIKQLELSINTNPSISEQQLLETAVDKTAGAGSLITAGVNSFGNRERVTTTEVTAQRDAGGLRVSAMYAELEMYSLIPLLKKLVEYFNQFQTFDETFPVTGRNPDATFFATVGPRELSIELAIQPRSATYVVARENRLSNVQLFIQGAAAIPQFAPKVNWDKLLDLSIELILDAEPEEYKVQQNEQAAPEQPQMQYPAQQQDPMAAAMMAADPTTSNQVPADLRTLLASQMQADGGAGMMNTLTKGQPVNNAYADESLRAATDMASLMG